MTLRELIAAAVGALLAWLVGYALASPGRREERAKAVLTAWASFHQDARRALEEVRLTAERADALERGILAFKVARASPRVLTLAGSIRTDMEARGAMFVPTVSFARLRTQFDPIEEAELVEEATAIVSVTGS